MPKGASLFLEFFRRCIALVEGLFESIGPVCVLRRFVAESLGVIDGVVLRLLRVCLNP